MSFFDSKQEVINIELTSRGKRLLSRGKFKPHFYSFHDNDIIYDAAYYGTTEQPTNAAGRIEDDTATLKPFYSVSSKDFPAAPEIFSLDTYEKENFKLTRDPIGTSLANVNEVPYFRCAFFKGLISGSAPTTTLTATTGETLATLNTPTITMNNPVYRGAFVDDINTDLSRPSEALIPSSREADIYSMRLKDNKYMKVKKDYILLSLEEENTQNEFESFSIALHIEDELTGEIKRLFFANESSNIDADGFLVEGTSVPEDEIDNRFVEYYLDISVDSEIDILSIIENTPTDELNQIIINDPLISFEEVVSNPNRRIGRDVDVVPDEDC